MIDRTKPEYQEAKWRVKIGHAFLEKGIDIKGVVHVGANDGYEVQYYLQLGIENILCFEPYCLAVNLFRDHYSNELAEGNVKLIECALGESEQERYLRIAPDTGQGSSFLRTAEEVKGNSPFKDTEEDNTPLQITEIKRFDRLVLKKIIKPYLYDCLVVDVQGMELNVLKGIGGYLKNFTCLNIECSENPVYQEEASAEEVIKYLDQMGFKQDSPIEPHNDIFFIRKDIYESKFS